MNSYSVIALSEHNDSATIEIMLMAKSLKAAESLAIHHVVMNYFEEKQERYPSNFYSTVKQERSRNRREFILSIHYDITDLCEVDMYLVEVKKCRDIQLYHEIIYS